MILRPARCSGVVVVVVALGALVLGSSLARAEPLPRSEVPEPLRPWIDWVLRESPDSVCPFLHGRASDVEPERSCAWPSRLELELDKSGGRFTQEWRLYRESSVPLPGDATHWPEDVRSGDREVVLVSRNGTPMVRLPAGSHTLRGVFRWSELPEHLRVPNETGLVALRLAGAPVASPERDTEGRLFLQREAAEKPAEDARLDVVVHRRLSDDVPLRLETRIELRVAGPSREVFVGPVLPTGFAPMALESPLPARLDPDGRIRVQVLPGTWQLALHARSPGTPPSEIAPPAPAAGAAAGTWDTSEVWVFEATPALRLVDIEGAPSVDPQQTELPEDWRGLPAYLLEAGAALRLVERRRGDADPPPDQLSLKRVWWLDFDGGGYTWHDEISGALRRSWRLEAAPPFALGRVAIYQQDQLITRLSEVEGAPAGVEVRQGNALIDADGRIEGVQGRIPAVGWSQDFQSVSGTLQLPPGWRLLHASGVDDVRDTWISGWSLLDIFGALITAVAFGQLFGVAWGALAGLTFALIWPEADAPTWTWLWLLGVIALRNAVPPEGRLAPVLQVVRWCGIAVLLLIAIPFSVQHLRQAMYPALARGGMYLPFEFAEAMPESPPPMASAATDMAEESFAKPQRAEAPKVRKRVGRTPSFSSLPNAYEPDPQAVVSTGPGLPTWSWQSVQLGWRGPVAEGQELHFWLIPPWLNRLLGWLRVALIAALALCVIAPSLAGRLGLPSAGSAARAAGLVLLTLLGVSGAGRAQAAELPPAEMLSELRKRLTEPPDCFPTCASSPRMHIEAKGERLLLRIELDVAAPSGVPLPGGLQRWTPAQVLREGRPVDGVAHDASGGLWIALPTGRHQILLEGTLAGRDAVQIPLPLQPHRVTSELDGWRLEGVRDDGSGIGEILQLTRVRSAPAANEAPRLEAQEFPAFVRVERNLVLGLSWRIETRVERRTGSDRAVFLDIPLLPGESVTDQSVRVENGRARVELPAGVEAKAWISTLAPGASLALSAPDATEWTEVWRLDASQVWHVEVSGIPPVHSETTPGIRQREWRPWPGERVELAVTRPGGVEGRTLTLDRADLRITPGLRASDATLELGLRASSGGSHELVLPPGAELQEVKIDGQLQPVRALDGRVSLPVRPGVHRAELRWRTPESIRPFFRTPEVDLGAPAVNAGIHVELARDRWILFTGGPRLGPAVLFWSALAVSLLLSIGLGRLPITPLGVGSWFLLFIGLSQVEVGLAAIVVGWLLALGLRRERGPSITPNGLFDTAQIALGAWSLLALVVLLWVVQAGLLGLPDMRIAGNGSTAYELHWYQDRTASTLPSAWVLSVPTSLYRIAMFAWATWLAVALLRWLRWGWDCYTTGGLWRPLSRRPKPGA